jgi:DNA-binding transcriptional ArsR family regulator
VSRPAVSQHLGVLREAGLVNERREGTRRLYTADVSGLAGIREFVDRFWRVRLDSLKDVAEETHRAREGSSS